MRDEVRADAILIDPPYSPRQVSEVYQAIGLQCSMEDTQTARMMCAVKDAAANIVNPGGIAICAGWNTTGVGVVRGFDLLEILLVCHGGAHNDTIITVERKN